MGGVEADDLVTSPTFVLVNEYFARGGAMQVYHIDAYRLESAAEFEALGVEEYSRPDSVVLVEWADRVWEAMASLMPFTIRLSHGGAMCGRSRLKTLRPALHNRVVSGNSPAVCCCLTLPAVA